MLQAILVETGDAPRAPDRGTPQASNDSLTVRIGAVPIYPFLVALYPMLALYCANPGQVALSDLWRPIGLSLAGTCIAWVALALVLRSMRKAAVPVSAGAALFFGYGHLTSVLPAGLRMLLLPFSLVVLGLAAWAMWRPRGQLNSLTCVLNLSSIVLVFPGLVLGVVAFVGERVAAEAVAPHLRVERPFIAPASPDLPDIYYIVLDAYGRSDALRHHYGFDNEPFLRALEQRGFVIARHSYSNYGQTVLSLASSLNMTYLDDVVSRVGRDSTDREVVRRMLDNSAVTEFLRALGYRYVYVGSGSGEVRVMRADLKLQEQNPRTPAEAQILGLTPLAESRVVRASEYDTRREFIRSAFRYLESLPDLSYPKFVLAHIAAPHPPFLFGPNGEPLTPRGIQSGEDGSSLLTMITPEEYRQGYRNQLQFVNRRILTTLDLLIRKSRVPPVIILQGDHGPRLTLDWTSAERTDLSEPFSILNAYLVPEQVRPHIPEAITPVNSFRLLLTHLFRADFKPLPDRTYFSTLRRPLDFQDVTDRLPAPPRGAAGPASTGTSVSPSAAARSR